MGRMRRLAVGLLVLVAILPAAACGKRPPAASGERTLADVHVGMTFDDVERIVGRPAADHVMIARCGPRSPGYWIYAGDRYRMTSYVRFVGNQVVEVVEDTHPLDALANDRLVALGGCGAHAPS
jgi:hypothetical protein